MRGVIQRVEHASVVVNGAPTGEIGFGLLVFLGVTHDDEEETARKFANKLALMRIFGDDDGKMNRSVIDAGGGVLVVSQFTLYGDTRKGNRPSFVAAARPEVAQPLVEVVISELRSKGLEVATGKFGADMDVTLLNQGPVTMLLEL